jgi:sulfur-oxidizing protein SoxY
MRMTRRQWQTYSLAAVLAGLGPGQLVAQSSRQQGGVEPSEETWLTLQPEIFGDAELNEGAGVLALETPARAEDAALVPVTVRTKLAADDSRHLTGLTVVIDENPAPVAARFVIGNTAGLAMISTRVRVDSYSYIHAIAQLSDGKLYVVKNFVKASGGCSAPAIKNADAAEAQLGQLKLRQFNRVGTDVEADLAEAQIQVRHPNYSGMQMDQISRLYIPANFVSDLKMFRDSDLLFSMDGGISMSENPNVRFGYSRRGAHTLRVEVRDSSGRSFARSWPLEDSAR